MHKSNIYMRHSFGVVATHMWNGVLWWGKHLNVITQQEIAG